MQKMARNHTIPTNPRPPTSTTNTHYLQAPTTTTTHSDRAVDEDQ